MKSKNQNEQIDAQTENQFNAGAIQPVLKKSKETTIKATLLHLDGTESKITMTVPMYTRDLDAYEDAQRVMTEYVNGLTRYWVQIERFQVQVGVMKDGQFEATLLGNPKEIPLNMVFEPGTSGKWITQSEAMSKRYENQKGGASC